MAWCLSVNHFIWWGKAQGNLVAGMKWFLGTYTVAVQPAAKLFGHRSAGATRALVVDGSGQVYIRRFAILRPPESGRAKLLEAEQQSFDECWCSQLDSYPGTIFKAGRRSDRAGFG